MSDSTSGDRPARDLQAADDLFRSVVGAGKDAMITIDRHGRIELFNPAAEEMFGYPAQSVLGGTLEPLLPEDERGRHSQFVESYFSRGQPSGAIGRTVVLSARHSSGRIFPIELSLSVGRRNDQPFVLAVIRDITERISLEKRLRQAQEELEARVLQRTNELVQANQELTDEIRHRRQVEEALREAESRFSRFASTVSDVICRFDPRSRRYDFISPSFERQTGYSVEQFLNDPHQVAHQMTHPEDLERVQASTSEHTRLGPAAGPLTIEYRLIRKDGQVVWVSETLDWDFTPEGESIGVNSVLRDITHRKQVEAEREQLIQELEEKNAKLERFTYTVSHDLKSPLITISGFLSMVEKSIQAGQSEQALADIERITRAADRMREILGDLLELSQMGRPDSVVEQVELGQVAEDAKELLAGLLQDLRVQVTIDPDLPRVTGRPSRLITLFQNLIENAAKFMGDQPEPRIRIGIRPGSDPMVLVVEDNGVGIGPEDQGKIFDLFSKLDPQSEGTGVGLALVLRIVELHGGRIWVESEGEGQGSRFCFTLPQAGELPA